MRSRIVVGAVLGCLLPAAAFASRAELDGRGLPRLLAFDSSLIRMLPGSASGLAPRLDVDVNGTTSGYYIDDSGALILADGGNADTFVLGVAGRSTHVGYLLDGNRHNLVIAGPGGWGFILGYERTTSRSESDGYEIRADTLYSSTHSENRSRSETLRLGAGWQGWTEGGRLFEAGVGIGPHHEKSDRVDVDTYEDDTRTDQRHWESDRGFAVDATLRTLSRGPGLQLAAQVLYVDPDPRREPGIDLEIWHLTGYLMAGWRLPIDRLDDFVFGLSASLSRSFDDAPAVVDSVMMVTRRNSTTVTPRLFASGEKAIGKGFLARGGIQAGGSSSTSYQQNVYTYSNDTTDYSTYRSGSWSFASPTFYLGAGWHGTTIALDAQVSNTLSLDRPVVRWSASVIW